MVARRKGERIEPSFGSGREAEVALRITAEDRAVSAAGTDAPRRRARPKADAGPDRAEAREKRRFFFGGGGNGGGEKPPQRARRGFFGSFVRIAFTVCLWGGIALVGLLAYFAIKLPQEAWAVPDRPPNVKIVSVTGDLMANRGLTGGEAVSLDEMSPYIPQAVMAIEDRRFYSHFGIDPLGILRAAFENAQAGATVQGGSTLTQQLAKNVFLTPDQNIERKIQEVILALWLETRFSKDQILEMYLNRVYFGSGATGVEAAARRYFNKSAKEVTLGEAALLAGLLKAPSRLSPAKDPDAAKARADIVLQAMLEEKLIDQAEYEAAKAQKATKARSYWTGAEHYAADLVMRDIKALVGDVKTDVVVETTIDLGLEKDAEKAISATIDGAKQNVSQGALVSVDGTGAIRAIVGGRDYATSQFNRAVDAKRQPGSAFKPFVYETALEQGWRPDTVVNDQPTQIGNWSPQNYDNKFRGPVTVADALAHSLNTIAAQLTVAVSPAAVIQTAQKMGIASPIIDNPSIALGTSEVSLLELTGAFAPFANGGYLAKPHLVNRITDVDGTVLYERGADVPPVIVAPEIVGMMNAMLTRVVTSGTGRKAQLKDWQVAGKTGTTQDFKDAWFVGYTANLTTGVWLGNDNGAPMKKVTGGTLPAVVWHSFMEAAHEGLPAMPLPGGYDDGQEPAPLTASTGESSGGFYDDSEVAPDPRGMPPATDPYEEPYEAEGAAPAPARSADPYAAREVEPEPRREITPEDIYGVEPLPGDPGYEGEPMRPAEEIAPRRPTTRVVRRDQLPPDVVLEGRVPSGAVLEGPVDGGGRPSDRSLFKDFFGG
ncbi:MULTISPECIES: transglycosylase domain-containing protein [unclassified Aureimonas]|uniref:transglycosylase domain-containing protein n=1 Tax=unclassified Aureimonas TaxID=2615206 RepID=UPI0007012C83|nr:MULTISPECIES: transglycosylase domain-containing protein [unclassified Aureimonas]KQT64411.1 penicillin-binding protein 1A [Aureimonas sp. Leaf427]KQT81601.1 penicillin-binding protein 1A [Aureimonas sp. Leaf460]